MCVEGSESVLLLDLTRVLTTIVYRLHIILKTAKGPLDRSKRELMVPSFRRFSMVFGWAESDHIEHRNDPHFVRR